MKTLLEPVRIALTVVHFPEGRTLSVLEDSPEGDSADAADEQSAARGIAADGSKLTGQPQRQTPVKRYHDGGYDPAWLLPFCMLVSLLTVRVMEKSVHCSTTCQVSH